MHVDVHEIVRRYKIVFDFPEAWRPLTVRQAVLSIVQTELEGGLEIAFAVLNKQRAKSLVSAALGVLQEDSP